MFKDYYVGGERNLQTILKTKEHKSINQWLGTSAVLPGYGLYRVFALARLKAGTISHLGLE